MDLYIYYRVGQAGADTLHGKLKAVQMVLQTRYGVAAGLKRRPGTVDGRQTWMEIYEHVPPARADDFLQALQRALDDTGVGALIEGERHVEHFEDVAPCA